MTRFSHGFLIGFGMMAGTLAVIHSTQPSASVMALTSEIICSPWEGGKRICDDGTIWIDRNRHDAF